MDSCEVDVVIVIKKNPLTTQESKVNKVHQGSL
jgi:hypothetical protein